MDRPAQSGDVIVYPQILHYVYTSESLISTNDKQYLDLLKKKRRINKYIGMCQRHLFYYKTLMMSIYIWEDLRPITIQKTPRQISNNLLIT